MDFTVYLPRDLGARVKSDLPRGTLSRLLREAVIAELERQEAEPKEPETIDAAPEASVSFDLDDAGFVHHLRDFGYTHHPGEPGSKRWQFTQDTQKGKDEFMSDPYFFRAKECNGTRHEYTADEMETHWRIMCRARDVLAREWARYQGGVSGENAWDSL